jgi:uncharacterized membrane protein YccC
MGAFIFGGWMIESVTNYIIGVFLWVSSAALIGVAGNAAAQAGLVSSTIVVTSVVLFVPSEFSVRLLLCLIGCCWALLLSLALWPLRPYSPLFKALSASCGKLADLADAFWSGAGTPKRAPTNLKFAFAYDAFISTLERSRSIWGAVRAHPSRTELAEHATLFQRKELERTTRHLIEEASSLAEIVSELKSGHPNFREPPEARFGPRPKRFDPIAEIRNNLSLRSSSFRHALRLGVATAIAGLIASAVHLVRGSPRSL